jgi:hypothetical protein
MVTNPYTGYILSNSPYSGPSTLASVKVITENGSTSISEYSVCTAADGSGATD